ncbi:hypothetical protein B484DRAFT_406000 [Ochromonadaceae sp. CCMP2298]|nr:hypothetical protein B484DRAFT_406000 [Ochromonadaceae sp. CCMP2298]
MFGAGATAFRQDMLTARDSLQDQLLSRPPVLLRLVVLGRSLPLASQPAPYASKDRNRFDLADESTLTDCYKARASWNRIQSQKVIPIGGKSLTVFLSSAKIFRPFYQRLSTTRSTLLQTSATFQSLFLEDLSSILLAGVMVFGDVDDFYYHYKSIPLREYGVIGETLIETLMEVLPMHTFDLSSNHSSDTTLTSDGTTTSEGDEGSKPQHSTESILLAWVRLYGKFQRHLRAVMIGQPQPKAHPSMPSFPRMDHRTNHRQGSRGGQ